MNKPIAENKAKAIILTITIVAPAGVEKIYDPTIPKKKHTIETIEELITTVLKLLHTLMEVNAGKIIKLEISKVPIILIPTTIVMAVKNAMSMLYMFAFVPVALAKFSSKVIANILL